MKRPHAGASPESDPRADHGGPGIHGDLPNESDSKTPAAQRKRRPLRWCVRLVALVLLASVAALLALYFTPISSPWIDRHVRRIVAERTGLALDYDRLIFSLSEGRVQAEGLTLAEPDDAGPPLLQADHVEVTASPLQFLARPPFAIDSITVSGDWQWQATVTSSGVRPDPRWQRLWERLAGTRNDDATSPRLTVRHAEFTGAGLALIDERPATPTLLARLDGVQIDLILDGARAMQVYAYGRLNGRTRPDGFRLTLRPDTAGHRLDFKLQLPEASERDFPWPSPVPVQMRGVELSGMLEAADGGARIAGVATVNQTILPRPRTDLPPRLLDTARLALDAAIGGDGLLRIAELRLESDYASLHLAGLLQTLHPFDYHAVLHRAELTGHGVELLGDWIPALDGLERPREARFLAAGSVTGRLTSPVPSSFHADVSLSGVDWNSEVLPAPLTSLQLDAELTTAGLHIQRLLGNVGGVPVELTGDAGGDLRAGRVDEIALGWRTLGAMSELMPLISQAPGSARWPSLAGDFHGEGTLRIVDPFGGDIRSVLSRLHLDGRIVIQNATLTHPALPEALHNLQGSIIFAPRTLEVRQLTGRTLGGNFSAEGRLEGDTVFWRGTRATFQVHTATNLAETLPALAQRYSTAPMLVDAASSISGRAELHARLSGNVAAPETADFDITLQLTDARLPVQTPHVVGPLQIERATLVATTATLRLEGLRGRFGALAFQGSSRLTPEGGVVDLRLEGPLTDVKERMPRLLRRFQLGGNAVLTHRATALPAGWLPPLRRWGDLWPMIEPVLHDPDRLMPLVRRMVAVEHGGQIQVRDVEWTHEAMPTPLRSISGRLQYDATRLWSPEPLSITGNDWSRAMLSSFEIVFPEGLSTENGPVILRYDGEGEFFDLGSWATAWKPHDNEGMPRAQIPARQDYRLDPDSQPVFRVEGHVRARDVRFHRLSGSDFDGRMSFSLYQGQPNLIVWNDVVTTVQGGRLTTSGDYFNGQLSMVTALEEVELPGLAGDLAAGGPVHGIFSGRITGNMTLRKGFGRFATPWSGDGNLRIAGSRFVSNAVLGGLGRIIQFPIFDDITFSNIHGPFRMEFPAFSTDGIVFENPFMNLRMEGTVGPERRLDLSLRVQFLRIADQVPFVGDMLAVFNRLAGSLLGFHIEGTIDEPRIIPL